SFRNDLYDGYKTGDGIDPVLWSQFHPLEEALAAMGVATWPMVDLEADNGLAQCVVGDRIVQVDRRSGQVRNSDAIRTKYGVSPSHIADYLALVGDTADGYPGIDGIGTKTAASLVNRYGHIE